jgi:hypothetical protein
MKITTDGSTSDCEIDYSIFRIDISNIYRWLRNIIECGWRRQAFVLLCLKSDDSRLRKRVIWTDVWNRLFLRTSSYHEWQKSKTNFNLYLEVIRFKILVEIIKIVMWGMQGARTSMSASTLWAIVEVKRHSQMSVIGWVTKHLLWKPPCFRGHVKHVPGCICSRCTNPHWAHVVRYGQFSVCVI